MIANRLVKIETNTYPLLIDIDFMLSGYECVYGAGCGGINGDPQAGCCHLGAEVEEEEVDVVQNYVQLLNQGNWENYTANWLVRKREGWKDWLPWSKPSYNTAINPLSDTCVFQNSKDFSGGAGWALHLAAKARGESHVGTKPYICWSIPLRLQWVDDVESWLLSSHTRGDWGGDDDWLVWWCIDTSSEDIPFTVAWNNESPLYQRHEEEIATMLALEEIEPEPLFELLDHLWERKPQVVTPVEITWG